MTVDIYKQLDLQNNVLSSAHTGQYNIN